MDTAIRDEIDRSFGDGPEHPPLEQQLSAGRRALRRRRGTAAAAACAVVVVLGASYAVATSGTSGATRGEVANDPTPSPTTSEAPWRGRQPVRYVGGAVAVKPGVVVHEHLVNPFGYDAPDTSDAYDLTDDGQRSWVLVEHVDGRDSYTGTVPNNGWATFADWVDSQTGEAVPGEDGWPETVRLDARGEVVAADGARIVQRTDDPRLGASFADPGTPTGAAVVEVDGRPPSYFVVWRVVDGELDVITTPPRDVVGATFDELLAFARTQYASEAGQR